MKEEIKDILNDLKDSAENPSYTEIDAFSDEVYEVPNYFTLDPTNGGSKALLNYIENLQSQLKAKEEVIKEAREYVEEHRIKNPYHYEYNCFMRNARASDLLEILSKGENKEIEFDVLKALNEDLDDDVEMSNM